MKRNWIEEKQSYEDISRIYKYPKNRSAPQEIEDDENPLNDES